MFRIIFVVLIFLNLHYSTQEIKTCQGDGLANCGTIEVSNKETVHLNFATEVKYVDVGSSFFAFKLDTAINLVKIKAKRLDETETTNLTVVTKDNYLYTFKIKVVKNPAIFTYLLQSSNVKLPSLNKRNTDFCYMALNQLNQRKKFTIKKDKIEFSLVSTNYSQGRYIFTYYIKNNSKIPLEIESVNLGIKRKKSMFRQKIAYQETMLYPYDEKCNFSPLIMPKKDMLFSLIYDRFYPPKGYKTILYLNEQSKEYARSLKKRLSNRTLLNVNLLKE